MSKSSLLITDRLILRGPIESDVLKLEAFDSRNTNRVSPWRSTEPGGKLDYASQVMKWKQEFEDGRAIRFLSFLS